MIRHAGLILLILTALLTVAFWGALILYQKQISTTVGLIEPDLANDLVNYADFAAEKRVALLRNLGFNGLSLEVDERTWKASKKASSCWKYSEFPIVVDGLQIGLVTDCAKGSTVLSFAFRSPLLSAAFIGTILVILLAYFLPLVRYKSRIKEFIRQSRAGKEVIFSLTEKKDQVIAEIFGVIQNLSTTKIELERANLQKAQQQALGLMAKQVAHDIRSPLSALNMVAGTLKDIPEEKRLLIRNATQRINDIANDLLSKGNQSVDLPQIDPKKGLATAGNYKNEIILLPALVDSLVSEKRIQFRDQINIRIESDFKDSFGAFVMADGKELMRLLSNLINNSIEAFKDKNGEVLIAVRAYPENIRFSVCDNGGGIPSEILHRLGEAGVSHGKEGTQSGSGLGIYHAQKYVKEIGGRFCVSSKLGEGTLIEVNLPRASTPSWFLESIQLRPGMEILCLDDDFTIHQIWKGRLDSLRASLQGIRVKNFSSAGEFKGFMQSQAAVDGNRMYLIDYELLGQSINGLSVIEELGLQENVVLVTSRYEEPEIKRRCDLQKIKILPKSLVGSIPIEIGSEIQKKKYDRILIDDDPLTPMSWQGMEKLST